LRHVIEEKICVKTLSLILNIDSFHRLDYQPLAAQLTKRNVLLYISFSWRALHVKNRQCSASYWLYILEPKQEEKDKTLYRETHNTAFWVYEYRDQWILRSRFAAGKNSKYW